MCHHIVSVHYPQLSVTANACCSNCLAVAWCCLLPTSLGHTTRVHRRPVSIYLILLALLSTSHFQTISEIKAVQKAHSNSRWRHTFSRSISMQSALDMFMSMRYTNLRFIIIIIIIIITLYTVFLPRLHGMQTRSSDENFVRLSVCLSNAMIDQCLRQFGAPRSTASTSFLNTYNSIGAPLKRLKKRRQWRSKSSVSQPRTDRLRDSQDTTQVQVKGQRSRSQRDVTCAKLM